MKKISSLIALMLAIHISANSYGSGAAASAATNNDIALSNLVTQSDYAEEESTVQFAFLAKDLGLQATTSAVFDVLLDGTAVDHITVTSIPDDYIYGALTVPANCTRGTHTLGVKVAAINGNAPTENTSDDLLTTPIYVYKHTDTYAHQKHLVQEFTATGCTYCYKGVAIVKEINRLRKDIATACVHGFMQSKDPFMTEESAAIIARYGVESFPSGAFNNNVIVDNSGEATICPGLGYDEQFKTEVANTLISSMDNYSIPTFASINIGKNINAKNLTINVSGNGTKEIIENDFVLTVYVCENNVVGRQLVNGSWKTDYNHEHVLRDVVTPIEGEALNFTSDTEYTNSYTITLSDDWNLSNVYIIAFVSLKQPATGIDINKMGVANAEMLYLSEQTPDDDPDGPVIDPDLPEGNAVVSAINDFTGVLGTNMSSNGKYVCGMNIASWLGPVIWNVESNTTIPFMDSKYADGIFNAISDNCIAVGENKQSNYIYAIKAENKTITALPSEITDDGSGAFDITADGSVICGMYYTGPVTTPCIWVDNKRIDLPVPTSQEAGFNLDGAQARWMSDDASVILGFVCDDFSEWPAMIWRKQADGSYVPDVICKDYFKANEEDKKPFAAFSPQNISSNGEWLALTVVTDFDQNDIYSAVPCSRPARMNLTTGELEVSDVMPDYNASATAISNDGTVLAYAKHLYTDEGIYSRIGYVWKMGEKALKPVSHLIGKIDALALANQTPCAFTADGKKVLGFATESRNLFSYVADVLDFTDNISNVSISAQPTATDKAFNLAGQRVTNFAKPGLYIMNGKKYLVK